MLKRSINEKLMLRKSALIEFRNSLGGHDWLGVLATRDVMGLNDDLEFWMGPNCIRCDEGLSRKPIPSFITFH